MLTCFIFWSSFVLIAYRSSSQICENAVHWLWLNYNRSECACAVSRDLRVGGQKRPHIWNPDSNFSIHYTIFVEPRWRLRVVYCILTTFLVILAPCQAVARDQWLGGKIWPHFWVSHTHISYSLCNFPMSILNIKGRFLSLPMLKQIAGQTPKRGFWGKNEGW